MSGPRKKLLDTLGYFKDKAGSVLPGHHNEDKEHAQLADEEPSKKDKKSKKDKHLKKEKKEKKSKKDKHKSDVSSEKKVKFASEKESSVNSPLAAHQPPPRPAPPPPPFRANPDFVEAVDLLERIINKIEPLKEINSTVLFLEGEQEVFVSRLANLRSRLEKPDEQALLAQEIKQLQTDVISATKRAKEAAQPEIKSFLADKTNEIESASSLQRATADLAEEVKTFRKPPKRGFSLFSCCCATEEKSADQKTLLKKESPSINRP